MNQAQHTPSPRRGEGRGEGARGAAEPGASTVGHPHPTPSLKGEGFEAQKLLGISLEGSVG